MKTEDDKNTRTNQNANFDVEKGLDSARPHCSWSSYLSASPVQFRIPNYSKHVCPAPELKQDGFRDTSVASAYHASLNDQQAGAHEHDLCGANQRADIYDVHNVTPGILRPEEYQNSTGRCRHHDNRYFSILDTSFSTNSSRRPSSIDEHDPESAATLVASPMSQALFDRYQSHCVPHRNSASSASSYSSRASETELPVTTNQLIRYYTKSRKDPEEELLTRRVSRYSIENNPWLVEAIPPEVVHSPYTQVEEKSRQGSAPPPYASRKTSHATPEHHIPYAKAKSSRRNAVFRSERTADKVQKYIYILKLCKAFLQFGIQAHRLEEYLQSTAVKLDITAEFQYVPHCMFIVLMTPFSAQNEVHLLKESTNIDLGRVNDVYQIYQAVLEHDADLRLAIRRLDVIIRHRKTYTNTLLILLHGIAAVCAGSFAFSARPMDFPALYLFGCLLAVLQLLVLPTPIQNSHILEVLTTTIIAFGARGLGSIYLGQNSPIFCFSGIAQGVIALILPGHIILAATHEIQNRQVLSGSVKMIYAMIYTLFLGFGVLIGSTLFGFIYPSATNKTSCDLPWYWNSLADRWRATYAQFVWVPLFALAISIMHQARPKHLPAMVFVATCGHQAFYRSLYRFAQNLQFAGMIAAFASGIIANIYARFTHCLAATILLPAILVHIPNALAASGSLVAGVETADAIVSNGTIYHTDRVEARQNLLLLARDFTANGPSGSTGLIVTSGFGMAQATIGITVGLFLSAFVVYPFTMRRAGSLAF